MVAIALPRIIRIGAKTFDEIPAVLRLADCRLPDVGARKADTEDE
jgi:hypothetical protein